MKRGVLIAIGVVLTVAAGAGWIFGLVTMRTLKDEVGSLRNDIELSSATVGALDATRQSLDLSQATAEASIAQGEEREATLQARLDEEIAAGMEAVSELVTLQAITDCQDVPPVTIHYTNNSAVSDDLKEWLGDIAGTIDHAEWDVIWTNSQAAIHRLYGEYLHVFIVSFQNEDLGSENGVIWVDRWCFLDR